MDEQSLPYTLADDEELLGFCKHCFRVRWLKLVEDKDSAGNPQGACRSCVREEAEAPQ